MFDSAKPVTAALQYTKGGVSGTIDAAAGTSVSLPLAKRPSVVKVNGKKTAIAYAKGVLTLTLKDKTTISISY